MKTFFVILMSLISFLLFSCDNSSSNNNCGDNVVDIGEECDGFIDNGVNCASFGYYDGVLACRNDCTIDVSDCEPSGYCGDNIRQPDYEICDGSKLGENSCSSEGFTGGELKCTTECNLDTSLCYICGDGSRSEGEECEGEDLNGNTCNSLGYYDGTLSCNPNDCTFDLNSCETYGRCGDNNIQSEYGEECEGDNLNGVVSCHDVDLNYYDEVIVCNNECKYATENCRFCGDGVVDNDFGEQCDLTVTNGETCTSLGYYQGTLTCSDSCTYTGCSMGYTELSVADVYACVLGPDGHEWCWGGNVSGELGDGTTTEHHIPNPVNMPSGTIFVEVANGDNSCSIDSGGNAWCWGANSCGELGNGSTNSSYIPAAVSMPPSTSFSSIGSGNCFACALATTGKIWCWGRNRDGQVGNGSTETFTTPQQATTPAGVSYSLLTVGLYASCALDNSGNAWCWGYNFDGELGNGTTTASNIPTPVSMPDNTTFQDISTYLGHTCALDQNGNAWCWGHNFDSELGNGTNTDATTPQSVIMPASTVFSKISNGSSHSCALDPGGNAWCWGSNSFGQLGNGSTLNSSTPTPVTMPASTVFTTIGSGAGHTCALDTEKNVWCWGWNFNGQLGDNTTTNSSTPVKVKLPILN